MLFNSLDENVKFFCNIFSKKIFNIVYLLFIIYNDIIRLQLQLFLSSFLKKCIEKRLSSGSHFLYAPLSFILLIFHFINKLIFCCIILKYLTRIVIYPCFYFLDFGFTFLIKINSFWYMTSD